MVIKNDGKVGINTTAPNNLLNVIGDINSTTTIYSMYNKNLTIPYDLTTNNTFMKFTDWNSTNASYLTAETNWNNNYTDFTNKVFWKDVNNQTITLSGIGNPIGAKNFNLGGNMLTFSVPSPNGGLFINKSGGAGSGHLFEVNSQLDQNFADHLIHVEFNNTGAVGLHLLQDAGSGTNLLSENGNVNISNGTLYVNNVNISSFGNVSGTGTAGYLPQWSGTNSLNNSAIYQNGSNIGIGTTNPLNLFTVQGTGDTVSQIYAKGSRVDLNTPTARFYLNTFLTTDIVHANDQQGIILVQGQDASNNTGNTHAIIFSESNPTAGAVTSDILFQTLSGGAIGSPQTVMDIQGNKIGINTTSPASILELNNGGGATADKITFDVNNGATNRILDFNRSIASSGWSLQVKITNSLATNNLFLNPLGGYVGIGTNFTNNTLDVAGPIFSRSGTFTGSVGTFDKVTDASYVMPFGSYIYAYNYPGTNVSLRKLIGLDSNGIIDIGQNGTAIIKGINLYAGGPTSGGNITFNPGGLEVMRITNYTVGGMVGINTTSPKNALNVKGDSNTTGISYSQNFTLSNGGVVWGNATCTFISSPNGSTKQSICNA